MCNDGNLTTKHVVESPKKEKGSKRADIEQKGSI